ncbi:hypothetical protein GTV32_09825 [Gordonia sp. SID5947]|uniref:hypothetical protein n=1 Tax=Gordonia sp. SID5947 TaxID=2690315 RepID=UPI00136AF552|nr:hypothetical protein [Gordonia sp. SID5947]MYR06590.1 hypothetical protein [Gordonia sp. SID5947]
MTDSEHDRGQGWGVPPPPPRVRIQLPPVGASWPRPSVDPEVAEKLRSDLRKAAAIEHRRRIEDEAIESPEPAADSGARDAHAELWQLVPAMRASLATLAKYRQQLSDSGADMSFIDELTKDIDRMDGIAERGLGLHKEF